jgi:hypothetical protein
LRTGRALLAAVAVLSVAWASVADNPAVCPDEQGETSHRHDSPASSHCCLSAPCHTPSVAPAAALELGPVSRVAPAHRPTVTVLLGIDSPAPPTPPPTALD